MRGAKRHRCSTSITARIVRKSFSPTPRFLANWLLMCSDIVVKNDVPLRGSRQNDALDMTPEVPILYMEVNISNFDVRVKSVLVEQNRTPSTMCHIEPIRQVLVVKIFNCFLQLLPSNLFFDGSFFSASRSWVPIINAEPFLCSVKRLGTSESKRYSSNVSSFVPRETQDWYPSRRQSGVVRWSRDPTSPKLKNRLVWTRRLPGLLCHMTWILFLEPVTECAQSVRIRTGTTLDQDCVLKATVQVCTACMDVSLLTTCMNFNTPPLAQIAPFDARFASQTRK